MHFSIEEATIARIHAAYRMGHLTARELVEGYLERIETYDKQGPSINSIVNISAQARERADELDKYLTRTGRLSGRLHGIPVAVKDCIETADMPTTFGSVAFKDYVPDEDATVVTRLKDAGAIILAKTTLPDFATSWWSCSSVSGETRNPYALDYDSGGSSSGSGAAVAANFVTAALGADCGGSVRLPASHCCLVGVRTTPGLVSLKGVSPFVHLQDTVGPMTKTVRDAAEMLDALVGCDPNPTRAACGVAGASESYAASLSPGGLRGARIGLLTDALGSGEDDLCSAVNDVVMSAVGAIRQAGAQVIEVEIPELAQRIADTSLDVTCFRGELDAFLADRPRAPVRTLEEIHESRQYHPLLDLLEMYAAGPEKPEDDPDYPRRLAARDVFSQALANLLGVHQLDALVFPDVQVPPPSREMINARRWTSLTFPTTCSSPSVRPRV